MTVQSFESTVTAAASAIVDAGKSRGKVAALFRALASDAYGDQARQAEVAETLTAIRREVHAKAERALRHIAPDDRAAFKKAVENSLVYGLRMAGEAAGCKFKFSQKAKVYEVVDAPAAGESANHTAAGKDENVSDQSRALVEAAEAAEVLAKGDRLAHLQGIVSKLIGAGYTLDEIESAVHAVAMIEGKRRTDAELAKKATEPKAPAIAKARASKVGKGGESKAPTSAEAFAAALASKGVKVKSSRKAKAKPAADASDAA